MRTVTTLLLAGAVAGVLFGTRKGRRFLAGVWETVAGGLFPRAGETERDRQEQQIDRQLQRLHENLSLARAMARPSARSPAR